MSRFDILKKPIETPVQTTAQENITQPKESTADVFMQIPIAQLLPFPNNPFKPYNNERLTELGASIREHGIIVPLLVRPFEGGYQIISGHNRLMAARLLGLEELPSIVRKMSDDESAILLVETNFKTRQDFLHSEKARAYKLEYDAIKRQGARNDLTFGTVYQMSSDTVQYGATAAMKMAETVDDGEQRIRQYVKISELIEPFLEQLDSGKLPFLVAYYLAFLLHDKQELVFKIAKEEGFHIDIITAEALKDNADVINENYLHELFSPAYEKTKPIKNIKIKFKKLQAFFKQGEKEEEIEKIIITALEQYYRQR